MRRITYRDKYDIDLINFLIRSGMNVTIDTNDEVDEDNLIEQGYMREEDLFKRPKIKNDVPKLEILSAKVVANNDYGIDYSTVPHVIRRLIRQFKPLEKIGKYYEEDVHQANNYFYRNL